jgi:hypothetical protein
MNNQLLEEKFTKLSDEFNQLSYFIHVLFSDEWILWTKQFQLKKLGQSASYLHLMKENMNRLYKEASEISDNLKNKYSLQNKKYDEYNKLNDLEIRILNNTCDEFADVLGTDKMTSDEIEGYRERVLKKTYDKSKKNQDENKTNL